MFETIYIVSLKDCYSSYSPWDRYMYQLYKKNSNWLGRWSLNSNGCFQLSGQQLARSIMMRSIASAIHSCGYLHSWKQLHRSGISDLSGSRGGGEPDPLFKEQLTYYLRREKKKNVYWHQPKATYQLLSPQELFMAGALKSLLPGQSLFRKRHTGAWFIAIF